jgi:hypothetical protein
MILDIYPPEQSEHVLYHKLEVKDNADYHKRNVREASHVILEVDVLHERSEDDKLEGDHHD